MHFCIYGSYFVIFIYDRMYQSTSSVVFSADQDNISHFQNKSINIIMNRTNYKNPTSLLIV